MLPGGLRRRIDASQGECWISPVSVWETGVLVSKGKYEIDGDLRSWFAACLKAFPVNQADLTAEIALRSHELAFQHKDPADRLIGATAVVHDQTLLTVDKRLASLKWLKTASR